MGAWWWWGWASSMLARMQSLLTRARTGTRQIHVERRLEELGHQIPAPPTPKATYAMCSRAGTLLFTGAPPLQRGHHAARLMMPMAM